MLPTLGLVKDRMRAARILVVGDVILDRFLYGTVERISPEAPVPVVDVTREDFHLGGAANVVRNLRALGARVDLVGVVGGDSMAARVRDLLAQCGASPDGLLSDPQRPTAVKTRVIAQHQQVVRFDREVRGAFPRDVAAALVERTLAAAREADGVIVSDYGKGVVDERLMAPLAELAAARAIPLALDPKPVNAACYAGVSVITPNAKETEELIGIRPTGDAEAERAGRALIERFSTRAMLVTRGEKGMTLVERDGPATHIPTLAKDVYDVSGAGDTAISVFTLAWAAGAALPDAARLANLASGIVVGKLGTAVTTLEEMEAALRDDG